MSKLCLLAILLVAVQTIHCSDDLEDGLPETAPELETTDKSLESDDEIESRLIGNEDIAPQVDEPAIDRAPEGWTPTNNHEFNNLLSGLYYQGDYDKINNELVDHVEGDDVQSNMDYALDWLTRESSSITSQVFKRSLVKALEQFTALTKINSANKCNRNTYATLYKNNKAVKDIVRKHPSELQGPLRRIDKLVHQISMEHAIACLPVYAKTLKSVMANFDKKTLELVTQFQDKLIDYQRIKQKSSYFNDKKLLGASDVEVSTQITKIKGTDMGRVAYDLLVKLAADDENKLYLHKVAVESRMVVDKQKINELVVNYFVAPCEQFIKATGPDVFSPANYDAKVLEAGDIDGLRGEEFEGLRMGAARYRLCKILIRHQKDLSKSVAWVVENIPE